MTIVFIIGVVQVFFICLILLAIPKVSSYKLTNCTMVVRYCVLKKALPKFKKRMIQKRRLLSAIMFMDNIGHSVFMHENEEKAAIVHQRHREVSQVEHYHGEIMQYLGDAISIFNRAVGAVECAIKIQLVFQEKEPIASRILIQVP
jgi:hypothetical protein